MNEAVEEMRDAAVYLQILKDWSAEVVWWIIAHLNNISTIMTAVATVAIGFFTYTLKRSTDRLWDAEEKQRKLSENTAKRQLRAYVGILQAMRNGPHQSALQFNLYFKNFGLTPAYDGKYWVDAKVCELPLSSHLIPSENKTDGRFELPPTHALSVSNFNDDNIAAISVEQMSEFNDGKLAFYIFGQLDFIDAFDEKRWLKFRFKYTKHCVTLGHLDTEEIQSN
jgi:hypothetical protein